MQGPVLIAIKLLIVFFIAIFIPATAYTFLRFRLKKKETEFGRVLSMIGIEDSQIRKLMPSVKAEYKAIDYILPVLFCFFTVLLTMTLVLFGGLLVKMGSGITNNLLLSGGSFVEGGEAAFTRERLSLTVLTMALLGAFIWSSQNIVRRLVTADLSPTTYYNTGIRMIMSGMIALMISFILPMEQTRDYVVVVAFLVGLFPEKGLRYLIEKVKFIKIESKDQSHPLPLEMIEGISLFHKVRFAEVGVDNAQNLAETNLILLMIRTPFNARKLMDWIGQAKLAVFMKEDLFKLTHEGVRTIFDFLVIGKNPKALEELAKVADVSLLKLQNVYARASSDEGLETLLQIQNKLGIMDEYSPGS